MAGRSAADIEPAKGISTGRPLPGQVDCFPNTLLFIPYPLLARVHLGESFVSRALPTKLGPDEILAPGGGEAHNSVLDSVYRRLAWIDVAISNVAGLDRMIALSQGGG
jgi:hypothetical protein